MPNLKLLRGKWMFVNDPERWNGEVHRFVVTYVNDKGQAAKVYSRSMFTKDIQEAIMKGGYG